MRRSRRRTAQAEGEKETSVAPSSISSLFDIQCLQMRGNLALEVVSFDFCFEQTRHKCRNRRFPPVSNSGSEAKDS